MWIVAMLLVLAGTLVLGWAVRRLEKRHPPELTPTQVKNLGLLVNDLKRHGVNYETTDPQD